MVKNKNKKSKIELELDSDIESDCESIENGNGSEDEEAVEVEVESKNGKGNPNDNEAKELLKKGKDKNSVLALASADADVATGSDKDESENDDDDGEEDEIVEKEPEDNTTFKDLGLNEVLVEACLKLGWKKPSKIQKESLPLALQGKDIIGLAETGSGKTGAFALPILQSLMENPQRLFALVLTPTRELAFQISEQFEALGARIGVKSCVIVGGIDMMTQALSLAKKPHIIIATPGRLIDHLENTKGFHLKSLKFLVMDEADRILNMDFEIEVDKILKVVPKDRKTYMFSATMTKKVQKLQRASLRNPAKIEVSTKYTTVDKLLQYYVFIPLKFKDVYLVHILNENAGNSFMVFCATCANAMRTALFLRNLGFNAIPLHGQMTQNKRLASLNKFRGKNKSILISTDVASRGLDIPHVDVVVNFDIPTHSKDYIHRVGRTARAGRAGKAITFVTQYDVELYQRIEHLIEKKLPLYKTEEDEVMTLNERVSEAQRMAKIEMKEMEDKKRGGGKRKRFNHDDNDDTEESMGVRKRLNKGKPGGGGKGNGLRNNIKGGKRGRMFN